MSGDLPDAAGPRPLLLQLARRLPPALRAQALTHSSWVEERVDSYERLEFLGDSVLGLVVASELHARFPEFDEGRLAKLKAFVVSRRSCAEVGRRVGLDALIAACAPASEEERLELSESTTAVGNVLEAVIGASFVTWGFEEVRAAVVEAFAPQVAYGLESYIDYKSTLQEFLAVTERSASYRLVSTEGPPHERVFTSEVLVRERVRGRGVDRSIKRSQQRAAHAALIHLGVLAPELGDPEEAETPASDLGVGSTAASEPADPGAAV